MQKDDFIKALKRALRPLLPEERERYLANYRELIDDKIEGGMNEAEAVASLGDVEAVAAPILVDAKEQGLLRARRNPVTVCMIALGSPVWLSLGLAAAAILLALYIVVWALIVCLCALELSLAVIGPAALIFFAANIAKNPAFAIFVLGMGFACAALAVWLYKPVTELIRRLVAETAAVFRRVWSAAKKKGSALA